MAAYRWSPWETRKFMQTGLEVRQHDNCEFTLSMERFCLGVEPININTEMGQEGGQPGNSL